MIGLSTVRRKYSYRLTALDVFLVLFYVYCVGSVVFDPFPVAWRRRPAAGQSKYCTSLEKWQGTLFPRRPAQRGERRKPAVGISGCFPTASQPQPGEIRGVEEKVMGLLASGALCLA